MMRWDLLLELVDQCDVVIEVLDARFPNDTRSKKLESLVFDKGKRLIIVLNKCDLVPKSACDMAEQEITKEGIPVIQFSAKNRWGSRRLRNAIRFIGNDLGLDTIKVGVVGYANVGKSSVISLLKGRSSAKAAPRPGFTRGLQWVRVSRRIRLLDSPGIIPREEGNVRLALKGAYDVTKLDDPELAAMKLLDQMPETLKQRAFPGIPDDPEEALEFLAEKWRMLRKGGELDTERAARKLLIDWQKGKLA